MRLLKILTLSLILFFVFLTGCSEKIVDPEGNTRLTLKVLWAAQDSLLPLDNAEVLFSSDYGVSIKHTDDNGLLSVSGMPSGIYNIAVRKPLPEDNSIIISGSLLNLQLKSSLEVNETILARPISSFGLSINELYYAAPVNDIYYFYDQFIELYNSSDNVKYLDGIMIMRLSSNSTDKGFKGSGADEGNDGDIDGVLYAFKFPGNPGEQNYPLQPKSFITLAQNARDHRTKIPKSIDLSNADWEFYNQFSATDTDNPNVPNLINIISDEGTDFTMRLDRDIIVVATGEDNNWSDGIDISTVIDGIQFMKSSTQRKTLDERVDRSFIISPPTYTGKSVQRRDSGVDTNNGLLDWEIITPTPGYQ